MCRDETRSTYLAFLSLSRRDGAIGDADVGATGRHDGGSMEDGSESESHREELYIISQIKFKSMISAHRKGKLLTLKLRALVIKKPG